MIDLEKRIGPISWRVFLLLLNLLGNVLLLYGAAGFLGTGDRGRILFVGGVVTLSCILLLALPSRD